MKQRALPIVLAGSVLSLMLGGVTQPVAAATEIKGAAILAHACGKIAVKQMGLLKAGKIDEANKYSTKEMQDRWKSMPAKDREMMTKMAMGMSESEAQYSASIKAGGVLVVDGDSGKLTVVKKTQDANGSSTSTTTQEFRLNGGECLVSR